MSWGLSSVISINIWLSLLVLTSHTTSISKFSLKAVVKVHDYWTSSSYTIFSWLRSNNQTEKNTTKQTKQNEETTKYWLLTTLHSKLTIHSITALINHMPITNPLHTHIANIQDFVVDGQCAHKAMANNRERNNFLTTHRQMQRAKSKE